MPTGRPAVTRLAAAWILLRVLLAAQAAWLCFDLFANLNFALGQGRDSAWKWIAEAVGDAALLSLTVLLARRSDLGAAVRRRIALAEAALISFYAVTAFNELRRPPVEWVVVGAALIGIYALWPLVRPRNRRRCS